MGTDLIGRDGVTLTLQLVRTSKAGNSTAGFWWVQGTVFFLAREDTGRTMGISDVLNGIAKKSNRWCIWTDSGRGFHHLASLGLDRAAFPTRAEALRHLTLSFEPYATQVARGIREMTAFPFAD